MFVLTCDDTNQTEREVAMDKIRVGVIGCGYWGPNLIRNFVEIPEAEMVVVADLRQERLDHIKSRFPQVKVTQDYQDFSSMNLDAVAIATPAASHYPIAKEFLHAGLNVMVEKPMTLSTQHAMELIDLAEAQNMTLMVGHTFEYNTAVHALKEIIQGGEIGSIYYADSARLNLGLYQPDMNVVWDLAPHDISILLYLLEKAPQAVSAQGTRCAISGVYDNVYMNMIFPDNILAHVHVSWLDPCKVRRTTIVGSKKMVVYNDIENNEKIKIYDKCVEVPPHTDSLKEFQCSYRYGDILIPNVRFAEPLRQECQHFMDCVANQSKPRSCGRDGLNVIKVIEAAERSLQHRNGMEAIL
jgi:predicted dehydrogenase